MYSINGVPLHEGHAGWRVLRVGTNTQGGVTNNLVRVPLPGRPGYTPGLSVPTEQLVIFNVRTPRNRLEELLALCSEARTLSRTDDPTKEAHVKLASAQPAGEAPLDSVFDVTITLELYEGVWRDVNAVTEGPISITTPSQQVDVLDGLSAAVYDADFFLRGVFGEFVLTSIADGGGGSGPWVKSVGAIPGQASGTGLLFIGSTQQAFIANESSPWTPVSDAGQYVDVSGNGGFRLVPNFVGGDPGDRRAVLQVTTLTQTSTTLRVRAKRAYRMN